VLFVFAIPYFYLVDTRSFLLATVGEIIGFGFVFGFGYRALPAFYTENFPTRYRASGHRRIETSTISAAAGPDCGIKFIIGPGADACFAVRRNVGRRQNAERHLDRPAAAKGMIAARQRMATAAIGGRRKIAAAFDRSKILKISTHARASA